MKCRTRKLTLCAISCRAPQGARGLKYLGGEVIAEAGLRRAPQGARGLKLVRLPPLLAGMLVAPRKGRVD